jgi:integrase
VSAPCPTRLNQCNSTRGGLIVGQELNGHWRRDKHRTPRLKPALEQAGIEKNVTMHGLRHNYASMLIQLKRETTLISEYLGHADVSMTMSVYAHFLKPKKQDTMSDLERLIENG